MSERSRCEIWKMFDLISPTYDRVNRAMTFGLDRRWRSKLADHLPPKRAIRLLDCATGTADQILALMDRSDRICSALGVDLAEEMLAIGRKKVLASRHKAKIELLSADLLALPLPDNAFQCATIAFGVRNVTDVDRCLREVYRVLTPGGRILILETSQPSSRMLRLPYLFYLRHLLPSIGGRIAQNREAYVYLNKTIETFPYGEHFLDKMQEAGFASTKAFPFMGGVVTLYRGDKE